MKEQRNPSQIHPPLGPYAHQIEVSGPPQRVLYLSGQVGMRADRSVPDSAVEQLEAALDNVLANLEAAGMTAADLVKLTIYLTEEIDGPARGEVLARRLEGATPALTLVYVPRLAAPPLKVELDAWASADA